MSGRRRPSRAQRLVYEALLHQGYSLVSIHGQWRLRNGKLKHKVHVLTGVWMSRKGFIEPSEIIDLEQHWHVTDLGRENYRGFRDAYFGAQRA